MAGPTFSFWYERFEPASCAQLEAVLRQLGPALRVGPGTRGGTRRDLPFHAEFEMPAHRRRGGWQVERTGTLGVSVERNPRAFPLFSHSAFERALGGVPSVELAGYCMANGEADRDALRRVAEAAADAFGGWVVLLADLHSLPDLPPSVSLLDRGVHEVVARELLEDATQPEPICVAEERWWAVDARLDPSWWVRK